ncbi:hypothetical protein QQF64_025001 [Cirrhinus molitorella]|uniref:Uncharacterized protein n=1 Tax=Cirrhinus molitorella TaxID=172907 RepID=A0ABR3NMW9_9TELE
MTNNIPTYPFLILIPGSSHPSFLLPRLPRRHETPISPLSLRVGLHKPELMYLRTGQKAIQGFKHQRQSRGWRAEVGF